MNNIFINNVFKQLFLLQ